MFSTYEEWLASVYRPVAGAETPPASTEEEVEDPEAPAAGEGEDPDEPDEPDDSVDDADADELDRIRRERDEARNQVAKAEAAARKAKVEARKAREEAAKKGGNWEQVAREREAEIAEANERAQQAETKRIEAQESLDRFQREVRINRFASKLAFKDPEDAQAHLAGKPELTGDDKSCERALRKLASDKPYLIDMKRARGRAMNGDGTNGGSGLTWEMVQGMTETEMIARWDEVQEVLAKGPGGG